MTSVQTASTPSSPSRTTYVVAGLIVLTVLGLVVALGTAAAASWTHLAKAFGAVELQKDLSDGVLTPRLAAVAVEIGLLALAVAGAVIAALTKEHDDLVTGATGFFAFVSFCANVYAGLDARTNGVLTMDALDKLSDLDWAVVIIGAGTLPIMVVVLTHTTMRVCKIASEWWDSQPRIQSVQTTGTGEATEPEASNVPVPEASVPADNLDALDEVFTTPAPIDPVAAYIAANGEKHVVDVASAVGISRSAVYEAAKVARGWRVERGMVKAA